MNQKLAVSAAVAASLVTVWAGGTAVTGNKVQSALQAQAESLQPKQGEAERALRVLAVQYDKGFLGATRTLTLAIGCGEQAAQLTWRDDIRHGPLPGFAGFGAARIDSSLVLSDAQRAELKKLLGDAKAEVKIRTLVALNGGYTTQVEVPALRMKSADGGDFEFKGLNAVLNARADGSARYEASMPAYLLTADLKGPTGGAMRMEVRDAKLQGEGFAPQWWAFSGKGSGSIGGMDMAMTGADGKSTPIMALKDISYTQDGSISSGLYNASGSMQAKGSLGTLALDAMAMKFSLKQVHVDSYGAAMAALMNTSCPAPGANPMTELNKMTEPLKALLPHNPQFGLDEFSITAGGQTAKLNYQFGTQGVSAEEAKGANLTPVLMKKAVANFGVDAPVALLPKLAEAFGKPVPPEVIEQSLAQAQAQGMLVREGDRISVKVEMRDGMAKLNGKPMPLPGMPAAPAPVPTPTP